MHIRQGSALAALAVALVTVVASALMDPLGTSAASPGEIGSWTVQPGLELPADFNLQSRATVLVENGDDRVAYFINGDKGGEFLILRSEVANGILSPWSDPAISVSGAIPGGLAEYAVAAEAPRASVLAADANAEAVVYVVGGNTGNLRRGVYRIIVSNNAGTITATATECSRFGSPSERSQTSAEIVGDQLYVIGGYQGYNGGFLSSVERTNISADCNQPWVVAPSTAHARPFSGSAVVESEGTSYIFVAAGQRHGYSTNTVEFLEVNSAGEHVGTWTKTDSNLGRGGRRTDLVEEDGFLYSIGGALGPTTVEYASVAGLIHGTTTWANTTSLTVARDHLSAISTGTYVYAIGGYDGSSRIVTAERAAPISADPPSVESDIDGTLGANGWYTSNVTLNWIVTGATSITGCGTQIVNVDTTGDPFTCEAMSAGGSDNETVEIKRDATDPVVTPPTDITVTTEDGPVDASHPAIVAFLAGATATDVTSGVISEDNDAPGVFRVRATLVTFTAEDEAGNTSSASATVTVVYGCDGREATIVGGVWHDYIVGTDGPDVIVGRGGNDRIFGKGGNDTICGGTGQDVLQGGGGNDVLLAGEGWDKIYAGDGDDILDGGPGQDYLSGHAGDDTITAGGGNDQVIGGPGADTIDGGDGHDKIRGDDGNDVIVGGEGWDRIDGGDGNDTIDAGAGHDSIRAGNGDDIVDGGPDLDHIYGGYGNDTLSGGNADDVIDAGPGDDAMDGGGGRDYCHGRIGNDTAVACEVVISVP